MRRERLARRWKDADVVRELASRGHPIMEASYRGYEAGPRPPSPPLLAALEAVFGSKAPDITKEAAEPQQLDGLIAAISGQTLAINRLVDVIASRGMALTDLDGLSREELQYWQERIAKRLAAPPTQSDGGSHGQPAVEAQDAAAREERELA